MPLARAAQAAGHAVAVTGRRALVETIRDLGFDAHESGPTETPGRRPLQPVDRAREERDLRGFAGRVGTLRARDVHRLASAWRPDALVCDEADLGAMVAADALGIPRATVLVLAAGSFARDELLEEPLNALRAAYGLPPARPSEQLARGLVLSPFPPAFRDPRFPPPTGTRGVRVVEPASRAARERPLVYVTLGTIFNIESGDLFERVLAGVSSLDVDVLATVGPQLDPRELGPRPANVRVERFVPQADALREAAAVVCHGGSGSVLGALTFGLPIVAIPLGADQPWNGDRIDDLGLGIVLDPVAATAGDVRDALARVLSEPRFAEAVAPLARECAALAPPAEALAAIEALASR